jgi:ribosomal protein S18 acetylase RimI-like enzyme
MGPGIEMRRCRREECEAVLDFWRRAEALESVTDSLDVLEALAADGQGFLVAVRSGRIVGTILVGYDGWRGHVYRLAVAPEERRRGLGARLTAEAEQVLRDLGARRVAVTVAGDDQRAAPFWESMTAEGWERDARAIRFVKTLR